MKLADAPIMRVLRIEQTAQGREIGACHATAVASPGVNNRIVRPPYVSCSSILNAAARPGSGARANKRKEARRQGETVSANSLSRDLIPSSENSSGNNEPRAWTRGPERLGV